jgi:hypothetical protein
VALWEAVDDAKGPQTGDGAIFVIEDRYRPIGLNSIAVVDVAGRCAAEVGSEIE